MNFLGRNLRVSQVTEVWTTETLLWSKLSGTLLRQSLRGTSLGPHNRLYSPSLSRARRILCNQETTTRWGSGKWWWRWCCCPGRLAGTRLGRCCPDLWTLGVNKIGVQINNINFKALCSKLKNIRAYCSPRLNKNIWMVNKLHLCIQIYWSQNWLISSLGPIV